jgi:hypothetical protein
MMMAAGVGGNLRSMGTSTPNPVNTNVNSSIIQELEGLPKRLNGKTKYQSQMYKVQKRIKILLVLRSLFALISVSLMQL